MMLVGQTRTLKLQNELDEPQIQLFEFHHPNPSFLSICNNERMVEEKVCDQRK